MPDMNPSDYEDQEFGTGQGTPLPDVTVNSSRKISVKFERKKDLGNYNNATASAWVEGFVPDDANESAVAIAMGSLFSSAVAAVLDTLDIGFIVDDDGNVREVVAPVVTVEQAERGVERALGGNEVPQGGSSVRVMNAGKPGVSTDPLPDWLVSECARKGITAVWDERHTATGRQPLFKEAVARGGVGHGKDGTPQAFWPPRS